MPQKNFWRTRRTDSVQLTVLRHYLVGPGSSTTRISCYQFRNQWQNDHSGLTVVDSLLSRTWKSNSVCFYLDN